MDGALNSHRRELTARESEMATLSVDLQASKTAQAASATELEALRATATRLQQSLFEVGWSCLLCVRGER